MDDLENEEDEEPQGKKKSGTAPKTRKSAPSRVVITKPASVNAANIRTTRTTTQANKMEVNNDDESEDKVKPLDGFRLVCSGEFELITRKKLEDLIDKLGGTRTTAVSGKTDYLIVGYKMEDGRDVT